MTLDSVYASLATISLLILIMIVLVKALHSANINAQKDLNQSKWTLNALTLLTSKLKDSAVPKELLG